MITIRCKSVDDTDRLSKIVSSLVFNGFLILANGDLGLCDGRNTSLGHLDTHN